MAKHYPKGLDGRMRDRTGEIRKKRSDTLVKTLREEYGVGPTQGLAPCSRRKGWRRLTNCFGRSECALAKGSASHPRYQMHSDR